LFTTHLQLYFNVILKQLFQTGDIGTSGGPQNQNPKSYLTNKPQLTNFFICTNARYLHQDIKWKTAMFKESQPSILNVILGIPHPLKWCFPDICHVSNLKGSSGKGKSTQAWPKLYLYL